MMNNQQLLSFSLKGFIFITAGERSVTCGEKVMQLINNSSNNQQQSVQFPDGFVSRQDEVRALP